MIWAVMAMTDAHGWHLRHGRERPGKNQDQVKDSLPNAMLWLRKHTIVRQAIGHNLVHGKW